MDGWDVWMDGWMDGWMDCLFVLKINVPVNILFSHVGTEPLIN